MQYWFSFARTPQGVEYIQQKLTRWYHLNVCPKCGKKVTTCTLSCPPKYICECITAEELEMNK